MKDYLRNFLRGNSLILIVFLLVVLCISLLSLNLAIRENNRKIVLLDYQGEDINVSDYPIFNPSYQPIITADAASVLDKDSGKILFAKNSNLRFPLASTTKIMTTLVALDHLKLTDILTVKSSPPEGEIIGFEKGEQLSLESMLYAMMLPSANDAAVAIADNFPGGREAFVAEMNRKAAELGLLNTTFEDPIGLSPANQTTAEDLARLASYGLDNQEIKKIVSQKSRSITNISNTKTYSLENLNRLLGENGVNGVKTGYTEEAGQVLVISKQETINGKQRTIIAVVMKSQDRFSDMQSLLSSLEGNITYLQIHP